MDANFSIDQFEEKLTKAIAMMIEEKVPREQIPQVLDRVPAAAEQAVWLLSKSTPDKARLLALETRRKLLVAVSTLPDRDRRDLLTEIQVIRRDAERLMGMEPENN